MKYKCPKCNRVLRKVESRFKCGNCGYTVKKWKVKTGLVNLEMVKSGDGV